MLDAIATASHFVPPNLPAIAKIASLLVLPFAHEDLAIVLGGYIIVNDMLPASLVALSIYGGMVASDFAIYGIGAGARHLPWLKRFAVDDRVRQFGETLKRNVFGLVALCRLVPGVVFVAFVACGWARVSLARFTAASLIVSALYLPLMLYLVIVFGNALDERIGLWAWPLLLAAFTASNIVRKRVFAFRETSETEAGGDVLPPLAAFGMPPLSRCDRKVAAAERIPPLLFYVPLALNWLRLGLRHRSLTLPTAANPAIVTGGMWGESKSSYFLDVAPHMRSWIADFTVLERRAAPGRLCDDVDDAVRAMAKAGLDYPVIVKPDIGWHGHGVRRVDDVDELEAYIARFPANASFLLQRYLPYSGEAAALYARLPDVGEGRILSLAFRYFPHVVGNGRSSLRRLIGNDERAQWKSAMHLGSDPSHRGLGALELERVPERGELVRIAVIGNQRAGALYRDGRRYITAAMDARFDAIARSMTEFHYGRFDLRFENLQALMRGEDFSIVEINGIGGEAIDCWDPNLSVGEVYRRLADQQRLLFMIGGRNRARGFRPTGVVDFVFALIRQSQLIRRYPASA